VVNLERISVTINIVPSFNSQRALRNLYEIYRTHGSLLVHKKKAVLTSYQQTIQLNRSTDIFQHTESYQGAFPTDITIIQQNCALEHTLILSVFIIRLTTNSDPDVSEWNKMNMFTLFYFVLYINTFMCNTRLLA